MFYHNCHVCHIFGVLLLHFPLNIACDPFFLSQWDGANVTLRKEVLFCLETHSLIHHFGHILLIP